MSSSMSRFFSRAQVTNSAKRIWPFPSLQQCTMWKLKNEPKSVQLWKHFSPWMLMLEVPNFKQRYLNSPKMEICENIWKYSPLQLSYSALVEPKSEWGAEAERCFADGLVNEITTAPSLLNYSKCETYLAQHMQRAHDRVQYKICGMICHE